MISPEEADALIRAEPIDFVAERRPIHEAHGRILCEPLKADREQPPYARATMDGIAIRSADASAGATAFTIQGIQAAGAPAGELKRGPHALEIMTGAAMPEGADCIVPIERVTIEDGVATLSDGAVPAAGSCIHNRGSDVAAGTILAESGAVITAPHIGIAASMGYAEVEVVRPPRIGIVSTGDELVPIDTHPEPHQIRRSNSSAIAALMDTFLKAPCEHAHFNDDYGSILEGIREIFSRCDVLILSGGVSMGKYDYVPKALDEAGVHGIFHRVRQRPGKPIWFGRAPKGQWVFGLPGNPVSALVCARRYIVKHVLREMGMVEPYKERTRLSEDVSFAPSLTYFLPVTFNMDTGERVALPRPTNTSGDFSALGATAGFVELPEGQDVYPGDFPCDYYGWS